MGRRKIEDEDDEDDEGPELRGPFSQPPPRWESDSKPSVLKIGRYRSSDDRRVWA
jgi:hypothetical protein